ncbi:MAG: ATP-binding protein [Bacteroidetes bacterium]|nr:ATP-binding protein [Bacteroidota bacterium]
MPKQSWIHTTIYQTLTERKSPYAAAMRNLLERPEVMDRIETILDLGATTPKDFTLHNSEHSFRVAEKMWELIPDETKEVLSDYELGLLLLSAYLHDIGMSPEFDRVQRHHGFLTSETGSGLLSEEEVKELQEWIDNDEGAGGLDIRKAVVNDERLSDYILSYYIRHKHNDWSGDWINTNLTALPLKNYLHWVDDLVLVCKSHHEGLDHLLKGDFDPKPIGDEAIVHLRYLAICLRAADVMENDPERTPEVILTHRQVSENSLKYWLKDHQFATRQKGSGYVIVARPDKAFIHKAIEDTADQIEQELRLCEELVRLRPLTHSPSLELKGYLWAVEPIIKRDIQPKPGTYEYIQGAFRPNTAKILELLGGNQLYGDSIWAFREIIQNAFDAVKERIAYQIITNDLEPVEGATIWGKLINVTISLERRGDEYWLVCEDGGVGMTKGVIERYFLQSGVSRRHEIMELERECKRRGFNLGRTGQFGIGVLSYFMLADKIVIQTKRELNTGYRDEESIGWRFEINGRHDFGELAKEKSLKSGTKIELKLKKEIVGAIDTWDTEFEKLFKTNVRRAPCTLHYKSFSGRTVRLEAGWTAGHQDIIDKIIEKSGLVRKSEDNDKALLTHQDKELRKAFALIYEETVEEIRKSICFIEEEGIVSDFVKYRLHIPYFKLKKGNSLVFLKEQMHEGIHFINEIGNGHIWSPDLIPLLSLKGIQIELSQSLDRWFKHIYLELDFEELGSSKLQVNRKEMMCDDLFLQAVRQRLQERVDGLFLKNRAMFDNCYSMLGSLHLGFVPKEPYWATASPYENFKDSVIWEKIKYPAVDDSTHFKASEADYRYNDLVLDGEKLQRLRFELKKYISNSDSFGGGMDLDIYFKLYYRLAFKPDDTSYPFLVMDGKPIGKDIFFHEVVLPSSWNKILLMESNHSKNVLNGNHPLVKYYDEDTFVKFFKFDSGEASPDVNNKVECVSFIIYAAYSFSPDKWEALYELYPDMMEGIFKTLGLKEIYFLMSTVSRIDEEGFDYFREETMDSYAPYLDTPEYLIKIVERDQTQ